MIEMPNIPPQICGGRITYDDFQRIVIDPQLLSHNMSYASCFGAFSIMKVLLALKSRFMN